MNLLDTRTSGFEHISVVRDLNLSQHLMFLRAAGGQQGALRNQHSTTQLALDVLSGRDAEIVVANMALPTSLGQPWA